MEENNRNNRINLEFTIEGIEPEHTPVPQELPPVADAPEFSLEFSVEEKPLVTDVELSIPRQEPRVDITPDPTPDNREELPGEAAISPSDKEFILPTTATFGEIEHEDIVEDIDFGIARTYMPTFSDTLDTPITRQPSIPSEPAPSAPDINTSPSVSVEVVSTVDAIYDPTAELEEIVTDVSIVNVGAPPTEEYDAHTTVFKFGDSTEGAPEENEPTIEELAYEEDELPTEESEPETEYTIPDPEEHSESVSYALVPTQPTTAPAPISVVGDDGIARGKIEANDYSAPSQRESFKDRFLDGIMSIKVRLISALIILAFAIFVENAWLFGMDIPALLALPDFHGNMALLDLHFILAILAITLPETIRGVAALLRGKATPELIISSSALVAVIYTVAATVYSGAEKYPLFATLFGISAVSAIFATLYRRRAEFIAFKLVSSSVDKKIVERKPTRSLVDENRAVDGKVEEYKSKTARVFRTGFVKDFFKRCKESAENSKNSLLILLSTIGVSLVSGIVAFFVSGMNFFTFAMVFAGVFLLGVPSFSILSHKIPLFHLSCEASYENSALLGEASVMDYAGVDVLTFLDTEVFTEEDVTLQRIVSYERSENIEKSMRQLAAVFSVVGGPLEAIFLEAISYNPPPATDIEIEADGICAKVSGKEVRVGGYDYMLRHGISVPDGRGREASSLTTRIMYSAEEGTMCAKLYLRYTLSEEFTMLMPMLLDDGITPLVYSRDPNISNELFRSLMAGQDSVRVLKRVNLENPEENIYSRASAGLVTTGDKVNVINMLILAKKYQRFQSRLAITELTSSAVGLGLGVVLALTRMLVVPSIILGAWQLAWCIALFTMSRNALDIPEEETRATE